MVFLLSLLGFVAVAAGVFGVGLGVPLRDTSFGAALLVAGSVAVTGGFILMGLAAAVRELRRVVQGFKAPLSGMPRPVRPLERRDEDRLEGADRRVEPPPQRMPVPVRAAPADMIPGKFDAPDTRERWRKPGPEEWLLRAMAEIEAAQRRSYSVPEPSDSVPEPIDYHSGGDIRRTSNSWPRPAIPMAADHAETEMRRTSAASSEDIFDTIWASANCTPEEGPEPSTEPPAENGTRPAESKSPPLSPAQPSAAPASIKPVRVEARPSPILKSGVIQQMAYTLFTDGSIEAQMSEGTLYFASVEEFRRHLEESEN